MRSVCKLAWGLFTAAALSAPVLAADTIDDVVKKLDDSYAKVKSYTVKMKMNQNLDMSGTTTKSDADGMMEYKRGEGKKFFMHSEMKMNTVTVAGGQETKMAQSILSVADGEFMWALVDNTDGMMKGQKFCTKMKGDMDTNSIKSLKDNAELKLLPDEKVDGHDCWVIEAKTKGGMDSRQVLYYRKDVGIPVKIVGYMQDKQFMTTTLSDLKLDASIPEDHFKFKVPDGVQVQDMTSMNLGGGAAAEGDKKAEQPKEEPKKEEPKKEEPKKEEPKKEEPKKPLIPKPKLP